MESCVEVSLGALDASALARLDDALAVRVRGAIDRDRAASWAESVRRARDAWTSDFGGAQFSLGRAWYTYTSTPRASRRRTSKRARRPSPSS
ncbi:MAG: hypothetical protein KF819_28735 [Labilithrix sp.]|nr:hypothetical protein [Labilithrix sp.]